MSTPYAASAAPAVPDFRITNRGSIFLLAPVTERARAWDTEHVASESWQWFGHALAIEWRFAEPLVTTLVDEGLEVA